VLKPYHPWHPMQEPIDLKHIGKLMEELGELMAACSRCLIQGIDECEPVTGKSNRLWLEEEIADVRINLQLVEKHFRLNEGYILMRMLDKVDRLREWHKMA
jgi:hypothetical protein